MTKKAKTSPRQRAKPATELPPQTIQDGDEGETEVLSPAERHKRRKALAHVRRPPVTDENKAAFLARIRAGDFPQDVCDDVAWPSRTQFTEAMRTDQAFADNYAEAVAQLADSVLEEAADWVRATSATGNIDKQRTAEIYAKSMAHLAEKLSPRTHGVLVKHAGADGGALHVSVTNFASAVAEPIPLQAINAPQE
jgi:hypothetical protein